MKNKILPSILCVIGLCLLVVGLPYLTKESPTSTSARENTKTVIRADSYVDLINYAPDHFRDFHKASDQTLSEEDYKNLEAFLMKVEESTGDKRYLNNLHNEETTTLTMYIANQLVEWDSYSILSCYMYRIGTHIIGIKKPNSPYFFVVTKGEMAFGTQDFYLYPNWKLNAVKDSKDVIDEVYWKYLQAVNTICFVSPNCSEIIYYPEEVMYTEDITTAFSFYLWIE